MMKHSVLWVGLLATTAACGNSPRNEGLSTEGLEPATGGQGATQPGGVMDAPVTPAGGGGDTGSTPGASTNPAASGASSGGSSSTGNVTFRPEAQRPARVRPPEGRSPAVVIQPREPGGLTRALAPQRTKRAALERGESKRVMRAVDRAGRTRVPRVVSVRRGPRPIPGARARFRLPPTRTWGR